VHRDLKPENVMIDEMGYPKLIDFGTAKVVEGRTFTIVGTPHYMAPEVISGKGYRLAADIWSIGIMLYEFMCGGVPFGDELEDSFKVYESVLTSKIIYPTSVRKIPQLTSLIDILLNRNAP
jgi:cGMP-dependent protein kinase